MSALSPGQREAQYDQLDDAGNVRPTYAQTRARVEAEREAQALEEREAHHRAMASDAARRPSARRLSHAQLLVDIGRAVHAVFPERADDIIVELEKRMPDPHALGHVVAWDPEQGRWLGYPEADGA